MSAMKRFTMARMAAALLSRAPCGRWRRKTLSTNMMTYRDTTRDAGKRPALSMWTSYINLLARAVVWCAVGARFSFAIEHAEHETSSPVNRTPCCLAVACKALAWAWERERWRWLMYMTLACFSMPGFRAAAVKKQSDSNRGFLPNSIFPNTELTRASVPANYHTVHRSTKPSKHSKTVNCSEHSEGRRHTATQAGRSLAS